MSEPTNNPQETPDAAPQAPGDPAEATGAAEAAAPGAPAPEQDERPAGPTIRDKRRIDPVTGAPRTPQTPEDSTPVQGDGSPVQGDGSSVQGDAPSDPVFAAKLAELEEMVAERTADLQRLQAEYANYKKRVDRDRGLARIAGIESVVLDLLPVLDSIEAAREHEELVGGFKLVADELEKMASKYGLEVFGEVGETFDPHVHDALMHMPYQGEEEITETVVSAVMQKGVKLNDRVLRPARVAVADPS